MAADQGYGGRREVAERWLAIAERLLGARDLAGSKRFAERAMEEDPLIDGVDQVLAVADVLLAGQCRINNQVDWYAVLQLPPPSATAGGGGAAEVKRQYRRLVPLLHPDRNSYPGADAAFKLVADAFAVLSDPDKKSLFDAEIRIAVEAGASSKPSSFPPPAAAGEPFWTACPSCFHVHQYSREYLNLSLRCPICCRPFPAAEVSSPPPIVAGTDMYYCSWGFFPLGFLGGPSFKGSSVIGPSDLDGRWKPFYPMFPNWDNNINSQGHDEARNSGKNDKAVKPQLVPVARNRKTMARKMVGGGLKKRVLTGRNHGEGTVATVINLEAAAEEEEKGEVVRSININEGYKGLDSSVENDADDSLNFDIDVDITNDILNNLDNLPFLKHEDIDLKKPQ